MGVDLTPEEVADTWGWRDIVLRLIDDLLDMGWDGYLATIKEKYGGLRFYIGGGTDAIFARIDEAEEESLETCIKCGKPGETISQRGWLYTYCKECLHA